MGKIPKFNLATENFPKTTHQEKNGVYRSIINYCTIVVGVSGLVECAARLIT
jgi:hypothetical protein